jgi:hypothetical protein
MQEPAARWLGAGMLAMIMLAGCGGGGGGSETAAPPLVAAVPQPAILFAGAVSAAAEGADAIGSMGGQIELDAGSSKDSDGGTLSFAWSMVSKPAGSGLNMGAVATPKLNFQPDVLGTYVFKLRVTNGKGGFAEKNATVLVNNRVPNAVVVVNASYTATPTIKPSVAVSAGSGIVLDATGSTDPDGDAVNTMWELFERPANSQAGLVVSGQSARFVADALGIYKVRARGADGKGAYVETVYVFNAANRSPFGVILGTVAVIDRSEQTVIAGSPVLATGALSYDEELDPLSYTWAVDSRPSASSANITQPSAAKLSFVPDVAGAYVLSLTVSDGKHSNVAYLKINALASVAKTVALPFTPVGVRYSTGLDRMVMTSAFPNALKIVNPSNGLIKSVMLPAEAIALNLSPDGKLAVVLYEGNVSLVDLESAQLVRTMATGSAQTEALVDNRGMAYLTGQNISWKGQTAVLALDMRKGTILSLAPAIEWEAFPAMHGIYSPVKNRIFFVESITKGSSGYINYAILNADTGAVASTSRSPYTYSMGKTPPLFLTAKEDRIVSSSGAYFNTDTLDLEGYLPIAGTLLSMSQSAAMNEMLVTQEVSGYSYDERILQTVYKRFTGELYFPGNDVSLPDINGQASYGLSIFHSANGNHVALVQTGSATRNAPGVLYHLVYR